MKKLSHSRKQWLLHRAYTENRKKHGPIRTGTSYTTNGPQTVVIGRSRAMPKVLCLNLDLEGTIKFFNNFRRSTILSNSVTAPSTKKNGRMKLVKNYFNFEPISTISHGAALIMAAEFDRIYSVKKFHPSPIDIEKWDDQVYGTLYFLGFFKLMGFTDRQIRDQAAIRPPDLAGLTIMPMISGFKSDITQELQDEIMKLMNVVDANEENAIKLCSSIVDAMENVYDHAYNDLPINQRKLIPRKWWISGSASKDTRTLSISIFDQGVSIPYSLPVKWGTKPIFAKIFSEFGVGPWKDGLDGDAIQAAMRLSSTVTGIASRGKGLHKIKETVSQLKDGALIILSRKGYYKWEDQTETNFAMETPLLGTYVELKAGF